ncbi:uncharacterized protein [Littorina saxatilis]|uniref:DUF4708 domain-containing protein n=1 Tax=Littorina saxatilis TaxID=31220 RepID=A0AAN9C0W6_9CAEN
MQTKPHSDPVVLFATKPDLNELCALSVRVEQGTAFSTTQPRILKCRELIFTEPDVIASPSNDQFDCFNVVLPQTLYKTGRLQSRLRSNNLQASKAFRVNQAVYQACLRYSLLARLAPAWNKAGDWLIQGRDFLSHTGGANAVKCELVANSDELYISVCAAVLRLAPLQLADLNLSALELQSLAYNAEHGTGQLTLHNAWCRVMPSLKKGRLCSISLSIPDDSPFSSYRELKRHWKNSYGFRLPETDEDMFFGQISFWGMGGKQFTYPSVCLRSEPLQCVPRVEPKPILSAFLQDLHSKLPSACGHLLRFQPQVRHTVSTLYSAAQEVKGPGPNLSKRSNPGSGRVALRDPRHLAMMNRASQPSNQPTRLATLKASVARHSNTGSSSYASSSQMSQPRPQSQVYAGKDPENVDPSVFPEASQPLSQSQTQGGGDDRRAQMFAGPSQPVSQTQGMTETHSGTWAQMSKMCPTPGGTRPTSSRKDLSLKKPARIQAAEDALTDHELDRSKVPAADRETEQTTAANERPTVQKNAPQKQRVAELPSISARDDTLSQFQRNFAKGDAGCSHNRRPGNQCPTDLVHAAENRLAIDDINPGENRSATQKIVPIFRPCMKKQASNQGTQGTNATQGLGASSTKLIPTFRPRLTKPSNPLARPLHPTQSTQRLTPTNPSNTALVSCPLVTSSTEERDTTHSQPINTRFPAPKVPTFQAREPLVPSKSVKSPSLKTLGSKTSHGPVSVAGKLKQKMTSGGIKVASIKSPAVMQNHKIGSSPVVPSPGGFTGGTGSQVLPSTPGGSQGKRKSDAQSNNEGGDKKARNKPQVQDVDVDTMARSDQLGKVNTVTLISWLKERGVHCKTKDKKADLVDRVKVFLTITSNEP